MAVVRVSGPQAIETVTALIGRSVTPRTAVLAAVRDPRDGSLIDRGLILTFPAPGSFTGEDVAELQVHGGPAVVAALLNVLGSMAGLRLAEPGEFSRRAFDNSKFDLSQAEGLADLVSAQTEAQRRLALAQAGGALRERAEGWRDAIVRLLAQAEADIDFSDEGDVDVSFDAEAVRALREDVARTLAGAVVGERIRDGLTVAVVGAPNVGKSSLINALAKRDVAIVSDIAGTTRDTIEVALDLAGVPVTLIDTAGLRSTDDPIEAEGIRRAQARAAAADLVLHVAETWPDEPLGQVVINKIDLERQQIGGTDDLRVSAATGAGLDRLEQWLADWAQQGTHSDEPPVVARERQRKALADTVSYLDEALGEPDTVLRAEALRLAARALGRVTGRVDVEAVLGEIFKRFCIGK